MKSLFDETTLAGMPMRNRFVRSATWERMADDQGRATERLAGVIGGLARGGVALIFPGCALVDARDMMPPRALKVADDGAIEGLAGLVNAAHEGGACIGLQLACTGIFADDPVAPSPVRDPRSGVEPREMNERDIDILKLSFARAAHRARTAGFDCVQIHAAHGFLLSKFLTPVYNLRSDGYGGSIENRSRLLLELFDTVKGVVGEDFPVLVKINGSDRLGRDGLTLDDCVQVVRSLADHGLAAVEVSGGHVSDDPETGAAKPKILESGRQSYFRREAETIAEEVDVPVLLVGGNRNFEMMTEILNETRISYFSMSRTLLSEPGLVNAWKEDQSHIPRCVSCLKCYDPDGNICVFDRKKQGTQPAA